MRPRLSVSNMSLKAWLLLQKRKSLETTENHSSSESESENESETKQTQLVFQPKWLEEFEWLRYNEETGFMHCKLCKDAKLVSCSKKKKREEEKERFCVHECVPLNSQLGVKKRLKIVEWE